MDNVKRIYRRSEQRLIPRRPCPDCGTRIRGRWKEHAGFDAGMDPQGDVTWRCFGEHCLTGKDGF
ncbi:hypothetical protein [Streptomyces sp. NPDC056188]|uniref:hypothetical protein n=1 Tax=Streptomyces sp. NPDC056188 TaxID=3345740 RepID=UPI0035DBF6BC